MMIRRHAAVAGAVVLGAFALTGCEKPTPIVTLVNGSDSVAIEETCKKSDLADAEGLAKCRDKDRTVLKVTTDTMLRVGVDKELADAGWQVQIGDRPSDVFKDKTFQNLYIIPVDAFEEEKTIPVSVFKLDKAGDPIGFWSFAIEKK